MLTGNGFSQSTGKGLKNGLCHVVVIFTILEIDVQGYSAMIRKRFEEFLEQGGVKSPDLSATERDMIDQIVSHSNRA